MFFNRRLFGFTDGVRLRLLLALFFGLLTAATGVSRLALSGYAIALVIRGAPTEEIILSVAGVVASAVFRGCVPVFEGDDGTSGVGAGAGEDAKRVVRNGR